jgi:hypothetical protein
MPGSSSVVFQNSMPVETWLGFTFPSATLEPKLSEPPHRSLLWCASFKTYQITHMWSRLSQKDPRAAICSVLAFFAYNSRWTLSMWFSSFPPACEPKRFDRHKIVAGIQNQLMARHVEILLWRKIQSQRTLRHDCLALRPARKTAVPVCVCSRKSSQSLTSNSVVNGWKSTPWSELYGNLEIYGN